MGGSSDGRLPASLRRVLAKLDPEAPLHGLAGLSPSDWRTLELALAGHNADRALSGVVAQHGRTPVLAPSEVDPRLLHRLTGLAWDCLPTHVEPVELSPVQALGLSHTLAGTPQDNVLSATRQTEVSGDPTAALCVEVVRRRTGSEPVHLATSSRTVRMQPRTDPSHTAHFRLLALVSGGPATGSEQTEAAFLRTHLGIYLDWLAACREAGFRVGRVAVRLTDFEAVRWLCAEHGEDLADHWTLAAQRLEARGIDLPRAAWDGGWKGPLLALPDRLVHRLEGLSAVVEPLIEAHPDVAVLLDLTRLRQATYYTTLGFHLDLQLPVGTLPLVDGGFVDWTQRLANNRKERALTSGGGLELLARLAAPVSSSP